MRLLLLGNLANTSGLLLVCVALSTGFAKATPPNSPVDPDDGTRAIVTPEMLGCRGALFGRDIDVFDDRKTALVP